MTKRSTLPCGHGLPGLRVLALLMLCQASHAGVGDIDPGFGVAGVFENPGDHNLMTVTPDGRILAAQYSDGVLDLFRLDPDGRPDNQFTPGGHLSTPVELGNVSGAVAATHSGGSAYLAFSGSDAKLVRINTSGILDPDFGMGGVVTLAAKAVLSAGGYAQIWSVAPMANGHVAVLVGYFKRSPYDCVDAVRVFRLAADGRIDLDYSHGVVQSIVDKCIELGGATLTALNGAYLSVNIDDVPLVLDSWGNVVQLPARGFLTGPLSLSADAHYTYLAGPSVTGAPECVIFRLLPDLSAHTSINSSGDDAVGIDFARAVSGPAHVESCRLLASGASHRYIYVHASIREQTGRTIAAVARMDMNSRDGTYDPGFGRVGLYTADPRIGGMAVLGFDAPFGLFAEQADGSLLLRYSDYAGAILGGRGVVRLLGSDRPSPGIIYMESPPGPLVVLESYPVIANVRRALGSQGTVGVVCTIHERRETQPDLYRVQGDLIWTAGEMGVKTCDAGPAILASGGYLLRIGASTGGAVIFDSRTSSTLNVGSWPQVSSPNSTLPPVSSAPVGNTPSGGGSLDDMTILLMLALSAARLLAPSRKPQSKSRSR